MCALVCRSDDPGLPRWSDRILLAALPVAHTHNIFDVFASDLQVFLAIPCQWHVTLQCWLVSRCQQVQCARCWARIEWRDIVRDDRSCALPC